MAIFTVYAKKNHICITTKLFTQTNAHNDKQIVTNKCTNSQTNGEQSVLTKNQKEIIEKQKL